MACRGSDLFRVGWGSAPQLFGQCEWVVQRNETANFSSVEVSVKFPLWVHAYATPFLTVHPCSLTHPSPESWWRHLQWPNETAHIKSNHITLTIRYCSLIWAIPLCICTWFLSSRLTLFFLSVSLCTQWKGTNPWLTDLFIQRECTNAEASLCTFMGLEIVLSWGRESGKFGKCYLFLLKRKKCSDWLNDTLSQVISVWLQVS